eukprot:gene7525-11528_t
MPGTALITVFDKAGIVEFAVALSKAGWTLLSCGGTLQALRKGGCDAGDVGDVLEGAGQCPGMFGGSLKTLQPAVHGAILAHTDQQLAELAEHGIRPIDMVVCNLAPCGRSLAAIDIGGSCLLRTAAKNYRRVTVVSRPDDYPQVLESLGCSTEQQRETLAVTALRTAAAYDSELVVHLT